MAEKKTLVIHHDGQITVSTFSPLLLGDMPLHKVVAHALKLGEMDYKQLQAKVTVTVEFKSATPLAYWEEED